MDAPRDDALVLDLDTRAGLAIVRSFGRAGLRVAVAAHHADAPGLRSRYAATRLVLPEPQRDAAAYADAIVAHVRDTPTDAVLTCEDASVEALRLRRDELERRTAPAIASEEALEIATDKERTLAVAAELGIAAPRSVAATDAVGAAAAAAELGLPVVLKPGASWNGLDGGGIRLGPLYAATTDEARTAADRLLAAGGTLLVQELAPGVRETVKLFRANGRIVARLAMRIARTWPPLGGSSVMRETVQLDPELAAAATRLVEAIGLDGYSEVEFRRAADGTPLLMEVNPRLSQSVELAIRAGVDFPRLQLEWARGGQLEEVAGYRVGVRAGWLAGEARLVVGALAGATPPRPALAATSYAIARDYLTRRTSLEGLDRSDTAPLAATIGFTARGAVRAFRRRGTRSPFPSPG